MKRSTINTIMAEAEDLIRKHGFVLPPFAYWTPEDFKGRSATARHVIDARCGWDITDYGTGRFDKLGLVPVHPAQRSAGRSASGAAACAMPRSC